MQRIFLLNWNRARHCRIIRLLADNAAIQLLNDSKIHYALNCIKSTEKKYMDYPIIAASTYESFGVKSIYDFVDLKDKITEANWATLPN